MTGNTGHFGRRHGDDETGDGFRDSVGTAPRVDAWWWETEVSEPGQPALIDGDLGVITRGDLAAAVRAAALFWKLLVRGTVNAHRLSFRHHDFLDPRNVPEIVRVTDAVLAAWNESAPPDGGRPTVNGHSGNPTR